MVKIIEKIRGCISFLSTMRCKGIFTYCWVIYLVFIISFFIVGDYKKAVRHGLAQMISRLEPRFDYYKEFIVTKHPDRLKLDECVYYYNILSKVVNNEEGQAQGMLAYCSYLRGDKKNVLKMLDKSIEQVPVFFWTYYNRGVYFFNEKNYLKASESFSAGIKLEPAYSFYVMAQSKIYVDIITFSISQPDSDDPTKRLVAGYHQAKKHLNQSLMCISYPNIDLCNQKLEMFYL